MATKAQAAAAAMRDEERAADLRARYQSQRCACGKAKRRMEPFCKRCLGSLGSTSAPRSLLRGEMDQPVTAAAYEQCAAELVRQGWLMKEVRLGD